MARGGRGLPLSPTFVRGAMADSSIATPASIAAVVGVATPTTASGTTANPVRINAIAGVPNPAIGVSTPTAVFAAARTVDVNVGVPRPDVTPVPLTTPGEVDPEYAWVHCIAALSSAVPS